MMLLLPRVAAAGAEAAAGRYPVAAAQGAELVAEADPSAMPVVVLAAAPVRHPAAAPGLHPEVALDPQRGAGLDLQAARPTRAEAPALALAIPIVRTTWVPSRSARIPVRHGVAPLSKVLAAANGARPAVPAAEWRLAISGPVAVAVRPSSDLAVAALRPWLVPAAWRLVPYAARAAALRLAFAGLAAELRLQFEVPAAERRRGCAVRWVQVV